MDALPALSTAKAKKVFSSFGVLSERELEARAEINWERYVKVQNIEANLALDIARTMIVPAVARHLALIGGATGSKGLAAAAKEVVGLADTLVSRIDALDKAQKAAHKASSVHAEAKVYKDKVIPAQNALREVVDELETLVADDLWPMPKYRELLFQY